MKTILYPGSFDPVTYGHLDIIMRCAAVFDRVIVAVMVNTAKQGLFAPEERADLIRAATAGFHNVEVMCHSGLLVDLARREGATLVVKGVRGAADTDSEMAQARANQAMLPGLETLLMPASPAYEHVSSSIVREIARFGGDVTYFVPPLVAQRLQDLYHRN